MATIFDMGGLTFFLPVFVFFFIFAIVYAVLEKTGLFGDEAKALNLIAAFSVAMISIFTGKLVDLVAIITPWIAFVFIMMRMSRVFIVMLFLFAMFMFFGTKPGEGGLSRGVGKHSFWNTIGEVPMLIIILVIVFMGLTTVFESDVSPYQEEVQEVDEFGNVHTVIREVEPDPSSETLKALTHPRLLSAMFLLIVAAISIKFLADKYEP